MQKYSSFGLLFAIIIFFTGCMADMRTALIKEKGITAVHEKKGKELIDQAWKKHGLDGLAHHQTYRVEGMDVWKGIMGKMGKPWPEAKSKLELKYAIGTFDSQAVFLDGKRANTKAGLQSWQYYEKELDGEIEFKKLNKRIAFGLAAYQYFFEMLDRLRGAPIISYAGQKEFREQQYDLVFVTWGTEKPHMDHDQYMLWINRSTGMLDYAVYTLRENYLKFPGARAFYGSIQFKDYQPVMGVMIPHTQIVYLNQPKRKEKKHLHKLEVDVFEFDKFSIDELYPDAGIEKMGDNKPRLSK
ncbi:MAG: hypothetical protein KTR30_36565 [Saprospiraceae bacterium]|nr:hypothetical protein [Saprospiraceae bacterium]